jgi:hypothetical protein
MTKDFLNRFIAKGTGIRVHNPAKRLKHGKILRGVDGQPEFSQMTIATVHRLPMKRRIR